MDINVKGICQAFVIFNIVNCSYDDTFEIYKQMIGSWQNYIMCNVYQATFRKWMLSSILKLYFIAIIFQWWTSVKCDRTKPGCGSYPSSHRWHWRNNIHRGKYLLAVTYLIICLLLEIHLDKSSYLFHQIVVILELVTLMITFSWMRYPPSWNILTF